jgi:uncharacterized Zn finger protein (UPF0148 family)
MKCKKCNFENDADAIFCENCGTKINAYSPDLEKSQVKVKPPVFTAQNELDKDIYDLIEVNSHSKNIFAAYRARKAARKVSKAAGKINYKEYVEKLQLQYFPEEHPKSVYGAKYIGLLRFGLPALLVVLFFCTLALGEVLSELFSWWYNEYSYYYQDVSMSLSVIINIAILVFVIWKFFISTYKKLKQLYGNF